MCGEGRVCVCDGGRLVCVWRGPVCVCVCVVAETCVRRRRHSCLLRSVSVSLCNITILSVV